MKYWAYLLSYDPVKTSPHELFGEINKIEEIVNWLAVYRGMLILVSEYDAKTLQKRLRTKTSLNHERFLVVDLATDRQGWLPKSAWSLINEPTPPKEEDGE